MSIVLLPDVSTEAFSMSFAVATGLLFDIVIEVVAAVEGVPLPCF